MNILLTIVVRSRCVLTTTQIGGSTALALAFHIHVRARVVASERPPMQSVPISSHAVTRYPTVYSWRGTYNIIVEA